MKPTIENESAIPDRSWVRLIPVLAVAASAGDPVARHDLKRLAEQGDAFPELLLTLASVLRNGFGKESATAPDSPEWLKHAWAVLAKMTASADERWTRIR